MPLSMYDASVPVFIRLVTALSTILDKTAAHAEARKIDPAAFLGARLYPDMFPLVRQVQIAADFAKNCSGRLAGVDAAEVSRHRGELRGAEGAPRQDARVPQGAEAGAVRQHCRQGIHDSDRQERAKFTGQSYLLSSAMPNFYFHLTTAYAILRHNGVEVGKRDYLGAA